MSGVRTPGSYPIDSCHWETYDLVGIMYHLQKDTMKSSKKLYHASA